MVNQITQNPYKYSDSNKRYQTFDYYTRKLFGEKCAKIPLDAGLSCPNIDGTKSSGGCIYCSHGSSGAQCKGTLEEQYKRGIEVMTRKWKCKAFIPYLQANTNTYAPVEILKQIYNECSSFEGAVMLSIATRADCLSEEILDVLCETAKKIPLCIELGLQSTNDKTAEIINRAHTYKEFINGYSALRNADKNIKIAVHLINGLPEETKDDMVKSAVDVASLKPDIIKFHLLHVLKETKLAEMFLSKNYIPMEKEEYVKTICDQLERISEETVVGRITGDGMASELLAPEWSKKKTSVANDIDKELFRRKTYQGIFFEK